AAAEQRHLSAALVCLPNQSPSSPRIPPPECFAQIRLPASCPREGAAAWPRQAALFSQAPLASATPASPVDIRLWPPAAVRSPDSKSFREAPSFADPTPETSASPSLH